MAWTPPPAPSPSEGHVCGGGGGSGGRRRRSLSVGFGGLRPPQGASSQACACLHTPPERGWGGTAHTVRPAEFKPPGSDVSEGPYTVGGGGVPPLTPPTSLHLDPPPPPLPFQCLRLTAQFLLRRLRCQEDLRFKIFRPPFGGDHRGTLGGGGGVRPNPFPPPSPLQTPPPPSPLQTPPPSLPTSDPPPPSPLQTHFRPPPLPPHFRPPPPPSPLQTPLPLPF